MRIIPQMQSISLRIPDSYDGKIAKNLLLLDILACNSANKPSFRILNRGLIS